MRSTLLNWNALLAKLEFSKHRPSKRSQRNHLSRRLRLESLEDRRLLAITVDNPIDELDTDRSPGDTSLRKAIFDADLGGETINFDPTTMNGATISLLPGPGFGEIAFDKSLTIDGTDGYGASLGITIDANDPSPDLYDGTRIFNITDPTSGVSPPEVEINGLTLTGGDTYFGGGGAILSNVSLTVKNTTIAGNASYFDGSGIEPHIASAV